jgi:hypothetical protein
MSGDIAVDDANKPNDRKNCPDISLVNTGIAS